MTAGGFNSHEPIYLQIVARIREEIVSGHWECGMQIPTVRELAATLRVNPNTVQRALTTLESENLLHSERTSGRFVTDNSDKIRDMQNKMANKIIENCISGLTQLGYTREQIAQCMKEEF